MFQSEIRRLLSRIGRFRWLGLARAMERREIADEIILAVQHMIDSKVGALIVIERDIGLRTFIESGSGAGCGGIARPVVLDLRARRGAA